MRWLRNIAVSIGCLLALMILSVSAFLYDRCVLEFPKVDALLATLPESEAHPPEAFISLATRLQSLEKRSWVAANLVWLNHGNRVRMMDGGLREIAWQLVLPLRYSDSELLALYAHFLRFEGGSGLSYGASRYFGKTPVDLSRHDVLTLLAIAQNPTSNSPERNPARLEAEILRLEEMLQSPPHN